MGRRYVPGAEEYRGHALAALTARVDALTGTVQEQGKDITALGRALAKLTSTPTGDAPGGTGAGTDDTGDDGDEQGQDKPRDWMAVPDADTAVQWLTDAAGWVAGAGAAHGLALAPCWPLHPHVVAEVIALAQSRQVAYASSPDAVSEWLGRWLPGAQDRLKAALGDCTAGHREGPRATYYVSALDLGAVARWWATDRATPAPAALRLAPLD